MITKEQMQRLAPRPRSTAKSAIWDDYVAALVDHQGELFQSFRNVLELQHFLAQVAHESGGFTILWESGAYSASRIMQIFGVGKHSAKITQSEANAIAKLKGEARAETLFERVYGLGNPSKAKELGNKDPGDGYRARGFGLLQTTGRRDHERLIQGDYTALGSCRAAIAEWQNKNCQKPALADDIRKVTKLINGGYNGLDDRKSYLVKAKSIFTTDALAEPPMPAKKPVPPKPPVAKVDDLANLGSSKAKKVKTGKFVTLWGSITTAFAAFQETIRDWLSPITSPLVDKLSLVTSDPSTVRSYVEDLISLSAPLGVVARAIADNVILLLLLALGAGWLVFHQLGNRMVVDHNEGRYVPPKKPK